MTSGYKECGFDSGKAVAKAREDAIIAAVHEDIKQEWPRHPSDSCPAYLADKRLGQTTGLQEAWTRVQALVDAADAERYAKLWPGGCLEWASLRDRFFLIMLAFVNEAPTQMGDRGEHTQSTDESSERYASLGRLRCPWEDKQRASRTSRTRPRRTARPIARLGSWVINQAGLGLHLRKS
jgi:hypothetical protein